jgi:hypothetical protein
MNVVSANFAQTHLVSADFVQTKPGLEFQQLAKANAVSTNFAYTKEVELACDCYHFSEIHFLCSVYFYI